jgi:pimeloyl-ACP methyl ester carboxylesterase
MEYFNFKNYSIEYEIFGHGKPVLLAFHGFGQHSSQFRVLEKSLGPYYRIFAINLFHHGESKIEHDPQKEEFDKNDLKELLEELISKNHFDKYSLAGYSLGGKIALCCIELFPERVEDVYLFAPDGMKLNPWYFATSHTSIGRSIYRKIVEKPEIFISILNFLKFSHILGKKMHKFIVHHMENRERRRLVYDVWILFRNLNPDLAKIQADLKKYPIRIDLFFGKYDIIIPPKIGENFVKGMGKPESLHVVPLGHRLIAEEMNPLLTEILKNKKDA